MGWRWMRREETIWSTWAVKRGGVERVVESWGKMRERSSVAWTSLRWKPGGVSGGGVVR